LTDQSAVRVAFDVTPMMTGSTGVSRYVRELGAALERRDVTLHRYALGRGDHTVPAGTRRVRVPLRLIDRSWRVTGRPRVEQLVPAVDAVHATTPMRLPPTRVAMVTTVYDLAAIEFPSLHPDRDVRQLRAHLRSIRQSECVVTAISETTSRSLVERGVDPSRIVVAGCGVPQLPAPVASAMTGRPYLLVVGQTSPRKDVGTVVRALRSSGMTDVAIVIAGPTGSGESELQSTIETLGLRSQVVRMTRVSDGELAGLYEGALALCFSSVAEGFGLPVLEALAAGTPVVASDLPVLREVAGDAALYAPVGEVAAWAAALASVVTDSARRASLIDKGASRARERTWEACADATIDAYRRAIGVAGG
jgi:glycosyltransferase involved in cell wall biosynthesis